MGLVVLILVGIRLLIFYPQKKLPLPTIDQSMRSKLEAYIIEHYKTPEEYIIDKFMDHDIIFLGVYLASRKSSIRQIIFLAPSFP